MATFNVNITAVANATESLTSRFRANFAIHHLRAATRAARNACEVEQANSAAVHGPWFSEMMLSVPVSIVMAGAALEANANEIVQDILDGQTQLSLSNECKTLLEDLKKNRSLNTLAKYRQLAHAFDKTPFVTTLSWEDARLLVEFRNTFMHFKPAWDDEEEIHEGDLVRKLKAKIPVARAYENRFQFPLGFITYGCAKWSIGTVLAFSANFSELLGVKDRFVDEHLDFTLPYLIHKIITEQP
jgi:hypothetical protein